MDILPFHHLGFNIPGHAQNPRALVIAPQAPPRPCPAPVEVLANRARLAGGAGAARVRPGAGAALPAGVQRPVALVARVAPERAGGGRIQRVPPAREHAVGDAGAAETRAVRGAADGAAGPVLADGTGAGV